MLFSLTVYNKNNGMHTKNTVFKMPVFFDSKKCAKMNAPTITFPKI